MTRAALPHSEPAKLPGLPPTGGSGPRVQSVAERESREGRARSRLIPPDTSSVPILSLVRLSVRLTNIVQDRGGTEAWVREWDPPQG